MYASCWRLHIGAISNVVRAAVEAASLGSEGQGTKWGPSEEIVRYPYRRISTPLYKASAAEGQAREAVSYFYRSFLSNLGGQKKCHEAIFTSFYVYKPST